MILKEALEQDIDKITELCLSWAKDMNYTVSRKDIRDDLSNYISNGVVILAEDKEVILGVMSGIKVWHFWVGKNIAHEHWFFVRQDERGKGVGRMMEIYFTAWAKARGCASVILSPNEFGTLNPEKAADRFSKYGYKIHGYLMKKEI